MIDYGYAQSELCWGTASPIPISRDTVTRICQGIKAVGGSRVRMGVQVGTWDDLDYAINAATGAGLKPLLCILGNETLQAGSQSNPVAFGALCKTIALRYGPSGTNQVAEYELFNESNNIVFNPPKVQAAQFVEFLKSGHTAIHSVHSSAVVMAGGTVPTFMVWFGWADDPVQWYTKLYDAGAKDYMDALAMHLYCDLPALPTPEMRQWKYMTDVRDLMVARGDGMKKIWVTEVGTSNPGPGISSAVIERDYLKAMVDGILSYDWMGPFYIYSFENTDDNPTDSAASNYGIVTHVALLPKQPKYDYCLSIAGTPSDPDDIVPPTPPTNFAVVTTGARTASATWDPAMDDVGVSVYRIYNAANDSVMAQTTTVGLTSTQLANLTPGTPYVAYMTALDAKGNESDPSNTFSFTTHAPSGSQAYFQYDFTGTGFTVPDVFSQLGLGFSVSSGVALPIPPTVDGTYLTVMPYTTDQRSPDHSSQVGVASASTNPMLAALSLVRMSPDGTQFAGSLIAGGFADACRIFTCSGGVLTIRDARNQPPLLPGEYLITEAEGTVYTAIRVGADGSRTNVLSWTDLAGVYPGATNLRTGAGFFHARVGGVNYPPPGITGLWKASDLSSLNPTGGEVNQMWHLAIAKPSRLGLVIATDLWEAAL